MAESIRESVRKRLFDARRCSDPSALLKMLGMHVSRPMLGPDDLSGLTDRQAQKALDFLDRWFPDRSLKRISVICAKAQAAIRP